MMPNSRQPAQEASDGGFIPPHGGYAGLRSYQMAEIVYDATLAFCKRFIEKRDRTFDQMIQAARSGKQNIVEGSQVSGTSKEGELKLIGVARASLEELLTDYKDFLRSNQYALWDKSDEKAKYARNLANRSNRSYTTYRTFIESRSADTVANIIICLIHQTNFLLDRQIRSLERKFVEQGGLREAMSRARIDERRKRP